MISFVSLIYSFLLFSAGTGCTATQTLTATITEQYLSSPSFPNTYPT